MHYYLSTWVGTGTTEDPFRPAVAAEGVDWWVIDLRPDASRVEGRCLVACAARPASETAARYLGEDPAARLSNAILNRLGNDLSLSLAAADVTRVAVELLVDHAREDGTRWRPLRALTRGPNAWELRLGGLLWLVPRVAGGASFTETFTAADGALNTTDTDLSWSVTTGTGLVVADNKASINTVTSTRRRGRAEVSADTVDHYCEAQVTVPNLNYNDAAVCGRWAAAVNDTQYAATLLYDAGGHKQHLRKYVTGTETALTARTAYTPGTFPKLLRLKCDGSTISWLIDGLEVGAVTDTSIDGVTVGGKRGGLTFWNSTSATAFPSLDDWVLGDLAAAPSAGAPIYPMSQYGSFH